MRPQKEHFCLAWCKLNTTTGFHTPPPSTDQFCLLNFMVYLGNPKDKRFLKFFNDLHCFVILQFMHFCVQILTNCNLACANN